MFWLREILLLMLFTHCLSVPPPDEKKQSPPPTQAAKQDDQDAPSTSADTTHQHTPPQPQPQPQHLPQAARGPVARLGAAEGGANEGSISPAQERLMAEAKERRNFRNTAANHAADREFQETFTATAQNTTHTAPVQHQPDPNPDHHIRNLAAASPEAGCSPSGSGTSVTQSASGDSVRTQTNTNTVYDSDCQRMPGLTGDDVLLSCSSSPTSPPSDHVEHITEGELFEPAEVPQPERLEHEQVEEIPIPRAILETERNLLNAVVNRRLDMAEKDRCDPSTSTSTGPTGVAADGDMAEAVAADQVQPIAAIFAQNPQDAHLGQWFFDEEYRVFVRQTVNGWRCHGSQTCQAQWVTHNPMAPGGGRLMVEATDALHTCLPGNRLFRALFQMPAEVAPHIYPARPVDHNAELMIARYAQFRQQQPAHVRRFLPTADEVRANIKTLQKERDYENQKKKKKEMRKGSAAAEEPTDHCVICMINLLMIFLYAY